MYDWDLVKYQKFTNEKNVWMSKASAIYATKEIAQLTVKGSMVLAWHQTMWKFESLKFTVS